MNFGPNLSAAPASVILTNGVRIEYLEQGPACGIPVVFLHGVTDSCRSFEPVLSRLGSQIRAFAISQRGHGNSGRPESGYRYSDFSEDLRGFLDVLAIPRAIIVGHSMGSMVAQRFAIDHPARIAGLILIGAFSTLYGDPGLTEFVADCIDPLVDPIPLSFAREWQLSTVARPIDRDFLETIVHETRKPPARVWHAAFHGFLTSPDFSRELKAVSVPILVVWGDRDTYATRAHQDSLLAAIPHARFSVYEGAGHALHWEDPGTFATEISAFIEETTNHA
jgi:non-heme chloroperoxidase